MSMQAITVLITIVGLPIMGAINNNAPPSRQTTSYDESVELFQLLDLDYPRFGEIHAAVKENDLELAKRLLADYLRDRAAVPWRFDPHHIDRDTRYSKRSADETVSGKVRVIGIWHTFLNGDIDWFYNPTIEKDELPVNHEWQWQLGRMGYWSNLGRAYWSTGDEVYAQTFVKQLLSWVQQCPRPQDSGNYAGSAWRTIECGIRMGGPWPDAYHRFLHSPSFTFSDQDSQKCLRGWRIVH